MKLDWTTAVIVALGLAVGSMAADLVISGQLGCLDCRRRRRLQVVPSPRRVQEEAAGDDAS